jgi:hypothetical protein
MIYVETVTENLEEINSNKVIPITDSSYKLTISRTRVLCGSQKTECITYEYMLSL